jgi:hypothetical protein
MGASASRSSAAWQEDESGSVVHFASAIFAASDDDVSLMMETTKLKGDINMRAVQLKAFGNPVDGLEYVDIQRDLSAAFPAQAERAVGARVATIAECPSYQNLETRKCETRSSAWGLHNEVKP